MASQPRTFPAFLAARAEQQPSRAAIIDSRNRALSFGDWHERSDEVAAGLAERGIVPGDRVALVYGGSDWAEFAVAYCAVQKAGAIAVPWSERSSAPDTEHMMRDSQARAMITPEGSTTRPTSDAWGSTISSLAIPGETVQDRSRADGGAQIIYTSGTTGRPKGVYATHANVTFGCTAISNRRPLRHSEHFLHAFPIGTNAGQTMLLNALNAHPTAICHSRFVPSRVGSAVETMRVGSLFVVPAMAIELLRARTHERHDLTSLVLVGSTAAALPAAVAHALAKACPDATVVNYYTSTESAPAQTAMLFDPARPDSVGRAVSGNLAIFDSDGHAVPPGVVGEVWMRVGTTPRSYFGDAVATESVFRGRWVRMGDVGRLDEDGYVYLVDRETDVIKSGAFKISTLHVEAALHQHDDIVEAAVFGVPHSVLGASVAAAIVAVRDITLPEIRRFLMERLPDQELPSHISLVERLPRNSGGKVLKRQLREAMEVS